MKSKISTTDCSSSMLIFFLIFSISFMGCSNTSNKGTNSYITGEKWFDTDNNIINAHGGGFLEYKDCYYWFGEHKGEGRHGHLAKTGVHCYSSTDLYNWKDEGIALPVIEADSTHPIAENCILERPKVIYNKKYDHFVMWFHLELKNSGYSSAMTGVALSKSVTGAYKFIKALRPDKAKWPVNYPDSLKNTNLSLDSVKSWSPKWLEFVKAGAFLHRDFEGGQMSRDMTLFVDDDQTAYHIHSAEENLTLNISVLTDDYLDFTGEYYRIFPAGHNEAPAVFKHENKYFMITSGCTGWDPNAARLAVASSMTGNWEYLGNPAVGENADITFNSQSTYVLKVSDNNYIFVADRWQPENPVDGRYIWLPVQFNEDKIPFIEWKQQWSLDFFINNEDF